MSLNLMQLKSATVGGALAREIARMEEDRSCWRQALIQTNTIAKQMTKLTQLGSAYTQIASDLKTLQSPAMTIAQQYKGLLGDGSVAMQTVRAWQEAQHAEQKHMRKLLDPLADIRKSLIVDSATQQLIKELKAGSAVRDHIKEVVEQASGIGSAIKMLARQAEESRTQTRRLFESPGVGSSIRSYLKDFEHINKQWKVPSEVLDIVSSFNEIQKQLGKVTLPTIDWGSASALAMVLGQAGIEEQLALLGIGPDGSMHPLAKTPEKGILSRKQADTVALVSLLLGILFFIYQEISNQQDNAKSEAFQTQTAATLQLQGQKIQNLTTLIEHALVQAAQAPEDRFVVRERTATVRSEPEHGAAVEGKLLPNEVVRSVERKGHWVEVEYYHWLHEEYRTGWVLKKYLERVPWNYSNRPKQGKGTEENNKSDHRRTGG